MSDSMNKSKEKAPEAGAKAGILLKLQKAEEFFVLLSACTKEPYVICDEETFDDEVMLYFDAEEAKAEAKTLVENKIPVSVVRLERRQFLGFYTSLYTLGINAVLVHQGGAIFRIQLEEFVKRKSPEENPQGKEWVENPALHLTALYYMQELRRQPGIESEPRMRELQEEITEDFKKGRFIIAAQKEEDRVPLIKLNEDMVYQPIFTDILEFQRFNRENKLRPLVVTADKLPKILAKEAKGIVLNPLGVNMPLIVQRPSS